MKILESSLAIKKAKDKFFEEIVRKYNLTQIELTILLFLKNGEYDTATDIVNELFIAKSHISLSVNSLVLKGYLQKIHDKEDRKIVHLKLTEKTQDIFQIAKDKFEKLEEKCFAGLTEEEKINMEIIFDKVYKNIREIILEDNFAV